MAEPNGNFPGGQAEYLRVPYEDFTSFKFPESSELEDEQVMLRSDVLKTAYWSAEHSGMKEGDTVIILGTVQLMPELYKKIEHKEFDLTDIITQKMDLDDAIKTYDIFDRKADGAIKVIFKP